MCIQIYIECVIRHLSHVSADFATYTK